MRSTISMLRFGASVFAITAAAFTLPTLAFAQSPGISGAAGAGAPPTTAGSAAPLPTTTGPASGGGAGDGTVAEVVVTGTAIRGVAPVGSATVNITRAEITQSGIRDPGSLISQLPQGSGIGSTLQSSAGRGAGVNLRGLGANATLLMYDGHRTVATGVQTVNQDPNIIPFAAIERVEVVTDGASAVYGSDAVAGVVNYILRRPFDGGEVTARWTHTLYDEGSLNGVFGKTWNGGGLLLAGAFEKNSRVTRYDVPQLRQDLRPFGGNDQRLIGTTVTGVSQTGGVIAGNRFFGLPSGLNGRTPTAAEVLPLLNSEGALVDRSKLEDFYTQRQRISLLARIQQDWGSAGELTVTGMYNRRTNFARGQGDGGFQAIAVTLRPNSPYYIPGLGTTGAESLVYNFRLNNPDRDLNRNDFEDMGNLLLDYKVPLFGDFRLTASGGFGISVACATCQPQANTILTSFIADPPTASLFNPYKTGPQASAEPIFGIFLQKGRQRLEDLTLKVDGSLFQLPAGAVRIATGAEVSDYIYHQDSIYSLNPTTTWTVFRYAHSTRQVYSGFGEAFVPIIGPENSLPAVQRLDLSMAIRYDKYSDFGATTNPKIGVNWTPFSDLKLRGSWGTSFRAPTLSETNFNVSGAANRTFIANGLNNPAIPVTNAATGQSLILNSSFRFAQLQPEKANIFSIGGDYTPSFARGLKLGVTYYNVDYKDRISALPNPTTALSTPAAFALYQPFFTVAPQPASCVNGSANGNPGAPEYATYNPLYLKYLNAQGSYPPTTANDCQLVGVLDTATRNLGRVQQSGLDFTLNYVTELPFGTLTVDGGFNKILKLKRNVLPGTPLVDALDVLGEQIGKRGRIQATLTHGPISFGLAADYIGGYLNNQTPTVSGVKLADQHVPAWTTFDLTLGYEPDIGHGVFGGTRVLLNIRNFTDKDAPVVLTATSAADLDNHNVFGRIITLEVAKKF